MRYSTNEDVKKQMRQLLDFFFYSNEIVAFLLDAQVQRAKGFNMVKNEI